MRILLAVDGSTSSDMVILEAASRPWPAGSEFLIVTVVDPFFFTRAPALLDEAKKNTLQELHDQEKTLTDANWKVSVDIVFDNPRHGLPGAAKSWKTDLIMLGSHGRGSMGRLLLGSTAQAVLRHAECSVEIVRRDNRERASTEGMHVLIPTDGSEHAEDAIESVANRPWPNGSEFRIISSPEYPVLVGEYPYYPPEELADLTKISHSHASESAKAGEARLAKAGLKVSREVTEMKDTPVHAILGAAESWKADLIVIGSHGRRGFDRLLLGSVSEKVALHAPCSVEVVRKPVAVL